MRSAAQIVCPDHYLHGARVRPVGLHGRTVVLLDPHGMYPRFTRIVVPVGMLSDDGESFTPGVVYTMCRDASCGDLLMLQACYAPDMPPERTIQIGVYVQVAHGSIVSARGVWGMTNTILYCNHPVTGEEYRIRPADLERAANLAIEDFGLNRQRAVITVPYHQLDGVRCRVVDGRTVMLIDDAPPAIWAEVGNAEIIRAGTVLTAESGQLSCDYTTPQAICMRCPRPIAIGLGLFCPEHVTR